MQCPSVFPSLAPAPPGLFADDPLPQATTKPVRSSVTTVPGGASAPVSTASAKSNRTRSFCARQNAGCREWSARIRFARSTALASHWIAESAGCNLAAYVTPRSDCGLWFEVIQPGETVHQCACAEAREAFAKRVAGVVRSNRTFHAREYRAGVQTLVHLHDRHAGRSIPGHHRALDRRGASPTR